MVRKEVYKIGDRFVKKLEPKKVIPKPTVDVKESTEYVYTILYIPGNWHLGVNFIDMII